MLKWLNDPSTGPLHKEPGFPLLVGTVVVGMTAAVISLILGY